MNDKTDGSVQEIMQWNDEKFSVRVESIDRQHKQIFHLVNDLYQALMNNKTHAEKSVILNELVDHTVKHFSHEENCFKQFGYARCNEHTAQHCDLVVRVSEFKKAFDSGKADISQELIYFLRDWLHSHIGDSDKAFTPYMLQNGIK